MASTLSDIKIYDSQSTLVVKVSFNARDTIGNLLSDPAVVSAGITGISATIGGAALESTDVIGHVLTNETGETYIAYVYTPAKAYPETIAGQIERLQDAKAAIKTSIENKGVTIGSSDTLDKYSCCIDSISSGGVAGNVGFVDLLVVGGGGDGGNSQSRYGGGGGGGGGVIYKEQYPLFSNSCSVVVGARNANSCFGSCIAYAGGKGGKGWGGGTGCGGGSGGGSGFPGGDYTCYIMTNGGKACFGQGNPGGNSVTVYRANPGGGAGGGGAGEPGCSVQGNGGGKGGDGFTTSISGSSQTYAGGGGGGKCDGGAGGLGGAGGGGQGQGSSRGCPATYYGGGGGGGGRSCCGGEGYQGIVILRYLTNGDCGIHSATGGTKYTCGNYTIHCFTSNGTFCIIC